MIRLVVGLGNPGREYERTRHNVGWMVLDRVSERLGIPISRKKFRGIYGELSVNGRKIFLLKPLTYMNRSGESVAEFVRFYKIKPEEVMVVYDDLDLPLGKLRLRLKGSSGGHRGVESVEKSLGTREFPRLRIGIGRPERKEDVVNYVLSPFGKSELPVIEEAVEKGAECLEEIIRSGEISQKLLSKCN
ncbi:MAG: aminoacyl-tRNA hydrolase [Desulfurobacteriaceae bacterium]